MIFMVRNTERICYDAEFDMWFSNHPYAPEYIFAPFKWLKEQIKNQKAKP